MSNNPAQKAQRIPEEPLFTLKNPKKQECNVSEGSSGNNIKYRCTYKQWVTGSRQKAFLGGLQNSKAGSHTYGKNTD